MGVFGVEILLVFVAFWLEWGLHWTRWRSVAPAITGEDGMPTLLWRYVFGVGSILLVFVAWAALLPVRVITPWRAALFLTADVAAAALGTVLPRMLAKVHQVAILEEDVEDREQALEARKRDA